jgi:hypothetical protein
VLGFARLESRSGFYPEGKDDNVYPLSTWPHVRNNVYPLSTWPHVRNPLGMDSGESVPVWLAFDIYGYL